MFHRYELTGAEYVNKLPKGKHSTKGNLHPVLSSLSNKKIIINFYFLQTSNMRLILEAM